MKTKPLALLFVASLPLGILRADDLPKPFTFARYQAMLDRSPFAVATAVAPVVAPNFAKDLYVANAARSKDGDMVTVASSADKNFKKYLTTNAPEDGYSITAIEWSDKVGATKVTIAKDGQSATLSFNEALLKQSIASGQTQQPQPQIQEQKVQPQAIVPQPGAAVAPPGVNMPKPMPVPSLPAPTSRVRGVIPRNPAQTPPPVVVTPQAVEPEL